MEVWTGGVDNVDVERGGRPFRRKDGEKAVKERTGRAASNEHKYENEFHLKS